MAKENDADFSADLGATGPNINGNTGNQGGNMDDQDEISILDLLLVMAGGKKLIIALTLLGGIAATIAAFTVSPKYTATAIILPPGKSSGASALLGQLGGLASLAGADLGVSNPADTYIGILESRSIADAMIAEFKLRDLYKTKTMIATRNKLKDVSSFETTDAMLIKISVTDKDPQRASDMANAYVRYLQDRNSLLAVSEAAQRRLFFEQQLEHEKNKLAEAEGELRTFQEQSGVIQVDSQVEAVIQSMMQLRAEITTGEVNLERLKSGATAQNPEVRRQEAALKALRDNLKQLEAKNSSRNLSDPLLPTSMMPEAGMEYVRKLREVKYRETLFEMMAQQYESARLAEAKESPLIQVVDEAIPPDWKSAPKRSLYILAGLLAGGIIGVFIVFVRHAASDPAQSDKVAELKKLLSFKR